MKQKEIRNLRSYYEFSPNHNIVTPNDFICMEFRNKIMIDFINELPRPPLVTIRPLNKDNTINSRSKAKRIFDIYGSKSDKKLIEADLYRTKCIQSTILLTEDDALDLAYTLISTVLEESEEKYDIEKIRSEFNDILDEMEEK